MPFAGGALRPHPATLASADRGSLACSPPGGLHSDVSRCCKAVGRQSRCSRSPDARSRHRRACPRAGAAATPGFFLLRSADCVIDDNWHTMGLAGTGSKNIVARDVFVPAHRTLAFAELIDATAPGMRANPNPLYRQSFLAVLPITIESPVLGMAEGALADFLAMAGVRTTRGAVAGGNRRMAELTTVQMRVAEASACIDAARLLMFRDLAQAFETAARGDPIGVDLRLRNRRDQAFCVRLLVGAIDALFLAAGGQGLFLEQPLQRAWRDAHAAASHISLNWDSTGSMYGQFMLGLEPKGQY